MKKLLFICCIGSFAFSFYYTNGPKITPYQFPETPFFTKRIISATNPTSIEGVELGRYLFYDPILSKDSSFSCATCHKQEFAFSSGPERFTKGVEGIIQARNTPPLFNLAWSPKLFWDGRSNSLEDQCFEPVRNSNEMNLNWMEAEARIKRSNFYAPLFQKAFPGKEIDSTLIAMAISQFERTLVSNNSKFDRVLKGDGKFTVSELRGYEILNDQSMGACLHCHVTEGQIMGTNHKFANNGLDNFANSTIYQDRGLAQTTKDSAHTGSFKIPSIRNLLFTAPYMHDGRFVNLYEVVDFYSSGVHKNRFTDSKMTHAKQGGIQLNEIDKKAVVDFLITMTDSSFITNQQFANPF